jgi:transcription initiation factor TFIIB
MMGFSFQNAPSPKDEPFRPDLNFTLMCPECKDSSNIVEEFSSGDMVCGNCGINSFCLFDCLGLVLGDRIVDTRSEWRTFANDENGDDPSRVGAVADPLLNGSQLDTIISARDGYSGRAKELSRTQTKNAATKSEQNLVSAYKEIGAMSEAIGLPKVVSDIAKQLYKKVEDSKQLKGKTIQSIIAACIFIACRQANVPRTFKEICALTKVPKNEIGRVYKIIEKNLMAGAQATAMAKGVDMPNANPAAAPRNPAELQYTPTTSTNAADLMIRFCNRLHLPPNVQGTCVELARRMADQGTLAGRSPISIAAAGIYFVSWLVGKGKTAKEVGDAAGVSEGTVRNAYKLIWTDKDKLVDPRWIESGKGSMVLLPS